MFSARSVRRHRGNIMLVQMNDMDGSVKNIGRGRLVLHSVPSKEAEEMVVSYLARMVKNVPSAKLAQKIKTTPLVLSKNIVAKKGERIAQNLRDLGAKADFVPHDADAQNSDRASETALLTQGELLHVETPEEQSEKYHPKVPAGSGKRLVTVMVVFALIAVGSLLAWQLYHLIFD